MRSQAAKGILLGLAMGAAFQLWLLAVIYLNWLAAMAVIYGSFSLVAVALEWKERRK